MLLLCRLIGAVNIDEEDGELREKSERQMRQAAEQEKNRVTWNTERRCYMDPAASKRYFSFFLHILFLSRSLKISYLTVYQLMCLSINKSHQVLQYI